MAPKKTHEHCPHIHRQNWIQIATLGLGATVAFCAFAWWLGPIAFARSESNAVEHTAMRSDIDAQAKRLNKMETTVLDTHENVIKLLYHFSIQSVAPTP